MSDVRDMSPDALADLTTRAVEQGLAEVRDGYAPFCKLIRLPAASVGPLRDGVLEITDENRRFLRSGYKARTPEELPVLSRWFEGVDAPLASIVDLVVYSHEQLAIEARESGGDDVPPPDSWGVVAILASDGKDQPMAPETILRNALGPAFGGSGRELNRNAYMASVEFWESHALVAR